MSDPTSSAPISLKPDDRSAGESASGSASFTPLYRQIKALIVQGLREGQWKPGELIPSEFELAARFQVSQGTVRKAVDELASDHLLMRRQGKGTFVATHNEAQVRYRFLRLAPDDEIESQRAESRVLECRRQRAPLEIARTLELRAGESVVCIRRLLTFGGVLTVLDELWLPGSVFRGLTFDMLVANKAPLYSLFESEFGISMVRADEQIRAVNATAAQAELLRVAVGAALLQVDRIAYSFGDHPMEVRRGWYLTDGFHYRNRLN